MKSTTTKFIFLLLLFLNPILSQNPTETYNLEQSGKAFIQHSN